MRSSGTQAQDFIRVLRPTLDRNNMTHIIINCCDTMGWSVMNSMLNQMRSVEGSMGVATGHAYTSGPSSPLSTRHKVRLIKPLQSMAWLIPNRHG